MNDTKIAIAEEHNAFNRLLGELRPKLHRYAARMTGSVIDGEDIVQESLLKAIEARASTGPIAQPDRWLFRIAHNTALDFLRRRDRRASTHDEENVEMIVDPVSIEHNREIAQASLKTFSHLPAAERSSVILKDVLGYSIQEIGAIIEGSVQAVKANLHRGRARLRGIATEDPASHAGALSEPERTRLATYVDRFNARDFDGVREMLADDVRLELAAKTKMRGRAEVGNKYFGNYSRVEDWLLVSGTVDGRPAVLVFDPDEPAGAPMYFVVLRWAGDRISEIRDFRYARYAIEGAELLAHR